MRLRSGWLGSSLIAWKSVGIRFGSYSGIDTITRTLPVLGSIATTAPLRPASPCTAALVPFTSRLVTTSLPSRVASLEPGEDRRELVLLARQHVVARLLQPAPAVLDERVADRVGEQPARRVLAHEHGRAAAPLAPVDRDPGLAVPGEDQAARDRLLLDQRAPVVRVVLEPLRVEHRPVGREPDQQGEQHDEQAVDLPDRHVHTSPPLRIRSARAWSETISSSASRTMLATIELPP